ncbi:MAG: hypothetical protein HC822_21725 [Oscillochloris sp.]|nr:hypothetical protein [Oscillochloris sp.]
MPFCRDLKAERITELTVVISNSEWRDRAHVLQPITPPSLHVTNVGCRGWQVEASGKATYKGQSIQEEEYVAAEATMLLDRNPQSRYLSETYRAVAGTATWSHEGQRSNCIGKGSGSYSVAEVPDGSVSAIMLVEVYGVSFRSNYEYDGARRYRAVAGNPDGVENPITYVCPNDNFLEPLVHSLYKIRRRRPVSYPEAFTPTAMVSMHDFSSHHMLSHGLPGLFPVVHTTW